MLKPSVSTRAVQHSPMPHAPSRPAKLLLVAPRHSLTSLLAVPYTPVSMLHDADAKPHVRASLPWHDGQASLRLRSRLVSTSSVQRCGALARLLVLHRHRTTWTSPFFSVARTMEYGQTFFWRRLQANPCYSPTAPVRARAVLSTAERYKPRPSCPVTSLRARTYKRCPSP
jgi:hypothetical protein